MRCLYCQIPLAPLRILEDGQYCSDVHREQHMYDTASASYVFLPPLPDPAPAPLPALPLLLEPAALPPGPPAAPQIQPLQGFPFTIPEADHVGPPPYPTPAEPAFPAAHPSPRLSVPASQLPRPAMKVKTLGWEGPRPRIKHVPSFVSNRSFKIAASVLPLVIAAAIQLSALAPSGKSHAVKQGVAERPFDQALDSVRKRAAVSLADDFREGLGRWEGAGHLDWTFDSKGFVRPGSLAVFAPSRNLTDYAVEYLAEIDRYALGFAFRIQDLKNYYAVKLAFVRGGPQTVVHLIRYSVVDGREVERVVRPLPRPIPNNSLYKVHLDVNGPDFTLIAEGQMVDYWSDGRFRQGGVGFFCAKGERAKLRWVEVKHQDDVLGRICGLFAPPAPTPGR